MKRSTTTGTAHNDQMKELQGITAETLLEVIDSLDRIDQTNKDLDTSNKDLTISNLRLQKVAIGIAVVALIVSIIFGIVALRGSY